jgi:hypothetical protein
MINATITLITTLSTIIFFGWTLGLATENRQLKREIENFQRLEEEYKSYISGVMPEVKITYANCGKGYTK